MGLNDLKLPRESHDRPSRSNGYKACLGDLHLSLKSQSEVKCRTTKMFIYFDEGVGNSQRAEGCSFYPVFLERPRPKGQGYRALIYRHLICLDAASQRDSAFHGSNCKRKIYSVSGLCLEWKGQAVELMAESVSDLHNDDML